VAAKVAALFVDLDADRSVPSIERALSGPDSWDDASWRRQVKVVTGGRGPGKQDRQMPDRDRARLPLDGSRRIAVLGCTSGAGQSTTALMIGHVLAAVREVPVAALDLNPGDASLAARIAPTTSVTALLAGRDTDSEDPAAQPVRGSRAWRTRHEPAARLHVIAAGSPRNNGARTLSPDDYQRLARRLAARYPLIIIDPAPSGLTRVLSVADQLVLVTPASPGAATSLANTQQWLSAHGYGELAVRAVTVVNGASRRTSPDVLQAESVARGRCRAIVRVPWDDLLSVQPDARAALSPQTKRAYAALAGVLVAGLAAYPGTAGPAGPVRGRSPGEHSD
jgi:MinD-like ATPase involved in chromosome partitioning or flagellar assembly